MDKVTVFFNNHNFLGVPFNLVVVIGSRPQERFKARFGNTFENLGFRCHAEDSYPNWEAFRKVYCDWADNWDVYKHCWFDTLVLHPEHEINLKKIDLTSSKYSW